MYYQNQDFMNNNLKFQSILYSLFGFAVLSILTELGLSFNHLDEEEYIREMSREIIDMVEVQRRFIDVETSQLAYGMTGEQDFKKEYLNYRQDLDAKLSALEQDGLVPDGIPVREVQMVKLIRERLLLMDELIRTRDNSGFDAVRDMLASGEGRRITGQISSLMDEINSVQTNHIQKLKAEELAISNKSSWMQVFFAVLNITLIGAALYGYRREHLMGGEILNKLQDSSRLNSIIIELNNGLQSCTTLKDAEDVISHFMKELFPEQSGSLYIMHPSRNMLEMKVNWGENREYQKAIQTIECWGLRLGKPHLVSNASLKLKCNHYPESEKMNLCIPMMAEGDAIGLLHFTLQEDMAQHHSLTLVQENAEILASQIGPGLASMALREHLKLQSVRDGLTGLYNRRFLEESIPREIHRAERSKNGFGLIMMDLDHFKKLNDQSGHQAGDEVLFKFAQFLKGHIRGEDIACRYGGEEFVLVLPGASLEITRSRAEIICSNVNTIPLKFHGEVLPSLTVSIGVARFPEHGINWDSILRAADVALYKAKTQGRDRVVVSESLKLNYGIDLDNILN